MEWIVLDCNITGRNIPGRSRFFPPLFMNNSVLQLVNVLREARLRILLNRYFIQSRWCLSCSWGPQVAV